MTTSPVESAFARVAPADGRASIPHFINGQPVEGTSGRLADVFNPATGQVSGRVALATRAEVDGAVAVAAAAFPAWQNTPPLRRARVMFKFRELVERELPHLAATISSEHGKVFSDARGEVIRGLEVVELHPIMDPISGWPLFRII